MFDIWHKITQEGESAIPVSPSALTALEWCEVGELYPHLVPETFRDFVPHTSPRLIRETPFVNEKGDEYLFVATSPDSGKTLRCGLNLWDMLPNLGLSDFHCDEYHNSLNAILVCTGCGVAGCAGIWSQTCHVSKWMVHWSVRVYDEEFELFFEREAYERGLISMLNDMVMSDIVFKVPDGSPYEDKDRFVEMVNEALQQRAYFKDMWHECEMRQKEQSEGAADVNK